MSSASDPKPSDPTASEPEPSDPKPSDASSDEAAGVGAMLGGGTGRWALAGVIVLSYAIFAAVFRIPAPPRYVNPDQAQLYCQELQAAASGLSSVNAVYALLLTLVFIGSTYLAMSLSARNDWIRRALFATTLLCAPVAFFLYRRSDAAVELAAAASEGLKRSADQADAKAQADPKAQADAKSDGTSYRICVGAWGEWVKSRIDSNQIGRVALQESAKTRDAELAKRLQEVEGISTKAVDAAERVETALTKVTQALESQKPEDMSAAKAAVEEANKAVRPAPHAPVAPPAGSVNPP